MFLQNIRCHLESLLKVENVFFAAYELTNLVNQLNNRAALQLWTPVTELL